MSRNLKKIIEFFKSIGPGFITGAADDDPSGIATYSIAGAQFGYGMLWLAPFLIPPMIAVQEMCARIGMVSGKGLASIIRKRYGVPIAILAVSLLVVANILNIGADLSIMSAVLSDLTHIPTAVALSFFAVSICLLEIYIPYHTYAKILTILGLTLVVYVFTAFLVPQPWGEIARRTITPSFSFSSMFLLTIVGFLGTTISPYLFFWQTSEEIEEEIEHHKISGFGHKPHIHHKDISRMRKDTSIGMIFSNLMTYFILLTTAATLHSAGITQIQTAQQASLALKPIAGNFAYLLFSIGIIGIGLQSIPVLAGSVGYALSDLLRYHEGLSNSFTKAKRFYVIIAVATLIGGLLTFIGIQPMYALYWSAIANGVIAVPLIALIIRLADDPTVVGINTTPIVLRIIGYITLISMGIAAGVMLWQVFFLR